MTARLASLFVAAALVFAVPCGAYTVYGVTPNATLFRFSTSDPATAVLVGGMVGFGANETVVGMDFRPADQELYVLTRTATDDGVLYRLNLATAAATFVATLAADPSDATTPYVGLGAGRYSLDFNPIADRLRVVGANGDNLRVNPASGFVLTDAAMNFSPGDPNAGAAPHVAGVAYTNSVSGTTTTLLYDIDSSLSALLTQNPPNNGSVNTVGGLGPSVAEAVGFDILYTPQSNFAYASAEVGGVTRLYTVSLVTGAASVRGVIGSGNPVADIAVQPDSIFLDGFE